MKKFFAIALVLSMVLVMALSAVAEERVYILAGVADAEGNVCASVTDDGVSVVDAEGNDVTEEWPVLYFVIDDESGACAFGDLEELANGTFEIAETNETNVVLNITLETEETITITYVGEQDAMAYVDEDGLVWTLVNMEMFAAEEAA